jgi:hypothetical protein
MNGLPEITNAVSVVLTITLVCKKITYANISLSHPYLRGPIMCEIVESVVEP